MTGATVISWGAPVRGREGKGLEVFMRAVGQFEALAKQGRIHGHREYIAADGNVSKLGGFMLIEGLYEELVKLETEEPIRKLIIEGSAIVENFSVRHFIGGSDNAVQLELSLYVESRQGLGYL